MITKIKMAFFCILKSLSNLLKVFFMALRHFKETVLLPVHTVMVTYCVTKMIATCLPIIGSFFKPGL